MFSEFNPAQRFGSPQLAESSFGLSGLSAPAMKAVIVEKDSVTRNILTEALASFGHEVVSCSTQAQVPSILADDLDALIFVNLDDARDAGLTFCHWLRS